MPELSVVIPTHDKLPQLRATLSALRDQDLSPDRWEVVVMDDASEPETSAWLREISGTWPIRIVPLRADVNVGRARARNLGAEGATGRWLLFLDDDIVAPPGLLRAHLDLLTANPGCGVIGVTRTAPRLIDAPHFHYIDSRGAAKLDGRWAPAKYLVTQNTSLPREDFLNVGGFDSEFSLYGFEDMEIGFRLEDLCGTRFLRLAEPVPMHVHHHTLDAYLEKKAECARGSLQHLARSMPRRLEEMKLSLAFRDGVLRTLAAAAGGPLRAAVGLWPTGEGHRPLAFAIYARVMDALIFSIYCQGVMSQEHDD